MGAGVAESLGTAGRTWHDSCIAWDTETGDAMETVIAIADLQSIYSVADVGRALGDVVARRNEGLKGWYDRMRELGGSRYIIKPSTTAAVDDLCEKSPNFGDVVDDLRKHLA